MVTMNINSFKTAKDYVDFRVILQEKYRREYQIPQDELIPVIDALRNLPRDEAVKLLAIYTYVINGDYGYGDWEEGYKFWLDYCD